MKNEEDEDDDVTIGVTRYPCLPSLVALQQMRNRLNMAHDGKRLMKWSAMATGRELRRIAEEIDGVFHQFEDDVKNCYIILARCRYHFHNFNRLVLESCANEACVTVTKSMKSVTGVRITLFDVVESGKDPYPNLCVQRGGETVHEAKKAWLELVKRLVQMLQLRTSFMLLDIAHNNAQKKMNVLGKIIIPRTEATIHYILSELEELAREEFFRLKKVQEVKKRRAKKKEQPKLKKGEKELECPICKTNEKKETPSKICIICKKPLDSDTVDKTPEQIKADEEKKAKIREQLSGIFEIIQEYEQKGQAAAVADFKKTAEHLGEKLMAPSMQQLPIPDDVDINKLCKGCRRRAKPKENQGDTCPVCKAQAPKAPETPKICAGCNLPMTEGPPPSSKKVEIAKELSAIMDIARKYEKGGIKSASVEDFKNIADQLRSKLKERSKSGLVCLNADENGLCPACTSLAKTIPQKPSLPPPPPPPPIQSKDPCPVCESFAKTLPKTCAVCNAPMKEGPVQPKVDKKIELREQLNAILKITKEYEQKGIESTNIAEFRSIAEQLQEKIKSAPSLPNIPDGVDPKTLCGSCKTRLNDKKKPVVEKKSSFKVVIKDDAGPCDRRGVPCSMPEGLHNVCSKHSTQSDAGSLHFLVDRLGYLIDSGKKFIARGLGVSSLHEFVKTCENTKCQMQTFFDDEPGREVAGDSQEYDKLQCCVRHVIDVAKDLKSDNTYTPSVEKFVKTCEAVNAKLEMKKLKHGSKHGSKQGLKKGSKESKKRLEVLKGHIDDVVQLTESYKSLGLEIPSVEKFIEDCAVIKRKIDEHNEGAGHKSEIDHLKGHIAELEGLATELNEEGLASKSFEDFVKSCKEFKTKLGQYKDKKPTNEGAMLKMIAQIDTAIGLSKEAKQEGLVSCSIDKFIKSCEDVKKHISKSASGVKEEESPPTPPGVLKDLKLNINVIIDLIKEFKKEGTVTPSIENFLQYCEKAKAKIDGDVKAAATDEIICSDVCNCAPDNTCTTKEPLPPPTPPPAMEGETYPCGHKIEQETDDICDKCCAEVKDSCEPCEGASSKDINLGYFEKKVRKIVRVTRTKNVDGTVKEEKETIIITQDMHDPDNEDNIDDDDDDYLGDMSYDSLTMETDDQDDQDDQQTCCSATPSAKSSKNSKPGKDDDSKVRLILYTGTDANRRGFCRKSKSEGSTGRNPPLSSPKIRQCLSLADTEALSQHNSVSLNFIHSNTASDAASDVQNETAQQSNNDAQ